MNSINKPQTIKIIIVSTAIINLSILFDLNLWYQFNPINISLLIADFLGCKLKDPHSHKYLQKKLKNNFLMIYLNYLVCFYLS